MVLGVNATRSLQLGCCGEGSLTQCKRLGYEAAQLCTALGWGGLALPLSGEISLVLQLQLGERSSVFGGKGKCAFGANL